MAEPAKLSNHWKYAIAVAMDVPTPRKTLVCLHSIGLDGAECLRTLPQPPTVVG